MMTVGYVKLLLFVALILCVLAGIISEREKFQKSNSCHTFTTTQYQHLIQLTKKRKENETRIRKIILVVQLIL
jgi:hypothetical protein